jgi:DNA-binding FadR family transcriptional regulator
MDPKLIEHGRKCRTGQKHQGHDRSRLAFHNAIYQASGNPLIATMAQQYWGHLRRVMGAVMQASRQREAVWDEHQAIADAIAAGHADRAAALIDNHSQQASGDLAERLSRVLQTQTGDSP